MKLLFLVVLAVFLLLSLALTVLFLNDNSKKLNSNSNAATDTNVYLSFDNTAVHLQKNQLFTSLLNINTAQDIKFQGYSIILNFDKTRLQLVNIDYTIGIPSIGLGTDITNMDDANAIGKITLFSEIQSSTGYTLSANKSENLAALQFKYIGTDLGQVSMDESNSSITKIDSNYFLLPVTPKMLKPLLAGDFVTPTPNIYVPQNTATPAPTQAPVYTPLPTNTIAPTLISSTKSVQKTNTPSFTASPTTKLSPTILPTQTSVITATPIMNTISPTQEVSTRMESKDLTNILIWIIVGSVSMILLAAGVIFLIKK